MESHREEIVALQQAHAAALNGLREELTVRKYLVLMSTLINRHYLSFFSYPPPPLTFFSLFIFMMYFFLCLFHPLFHYPPLFVLAKVCRFGR